MDKLIIIMVQIILFLWFGFDNEYSVGDAVA